MAAIAGSSSAPRRAWRLTLCLQGDDEREIEIALDHIAREWALGYLRGPNACSGGPGSGYTLETSHDPAITHESYFAAVAEYLARERAGSAGSSSAATIATP